MPAKVISIRPQPGESDAQASAKAILSPVLRAAISAVSTSDLTAGVDVDEAVDVLAAQVALILDPESTGAESVLAAQCLTLDTVAHAILARAFRPGVPIGEYNKLMTLALRAQSQSANAVKLIIRTRPKPSEPEYLEPPYDYPPEPEPEYEPH